MESLIFKKSLRALKLYNTLISSTNIYNVNARNYSKTGILCLATFLETTEYL